MFAGNGSYPVIYGPLPRLRGDFPFLGFESGIPLEHDGVRFVETFEETRGVRLETHFRH